MNPSKKTEEKEQKPNFSLQKTPLLVLLVPALISFIIITLVAILFLTR